MATALTQRADTKIDLKQLGEALERVGANTKCPFSDNDNDHGGWSFAEQFVSIVPYSRNRGAVLGGTSYPVVMIACNGCGYTALFNAVMLGLLDAESPNE